MRGNTIHITTISGINSHRDNPHSLTCVHNSLGGYSGLCLHCQEEYKSDPVHYVMYGNHPAGLERWAEIERLMTECRSGAGDNSNPHLAHLHTGENYKPGHSSDFPF